MSEIHIDSQIHMCRAELLRTCENWFSQHYWERQELILKDGRLESKWGTVIRRNIFPYSPVTGTIDRLYCNSYFFLTFESLFGNV